MLQTFVLQFSFKISFKFNVLYEMSQTTFEKEIYVKKVVGSIKATDLFS